MLKWKALKSTLLGQVKVQGAGLGMVCRTEHSGATQRGEGETCRVKDDIIMIKDGAQFRKNPFEQQLWLRVGLHPSPRPQLHSVITSALSAFDLTGHLLRAYLLRSVIKLCKLGRHINLFIKKILALYLALVPRDHGDSLLRNSWRSLK